MFTISEDWKTTYPDAMVGILVMRDVISPEHHPELQERKVALERELRSRFAGYTRAMLKELPTVQTYNSHYRRFGKNYHVQLQLESVALKDRSIPSVSALVEAMFMAELKNFLLTAGHDLGAVDPPITLGVSDGSEHYTLLNGREQVLKPGDMMMTDSQGVISSVLYGPDRRTRITPETKEVLFVVYAPAGIDEDTVRRHLLDIRSHVILIAPEAEVMTQRILGATDVDDS